MALAAPLLSGGCERARPAAPPGRPGSVVLITLDTARYDAFGFDGNRRVATPNLDRLAAEGRVFTFAHAHSVVTLPSHASILTGLYPYQHGVRDNQGFRLADSIPTAATMLKSRGFATGAFVGAFPLDSRFGLSRGFDVYDQQYPQGAHEYDFAVAERPAVEVVSAARRWRDGLGARPFFLWVHLYDCHAPYRPPAPFDRTFADDPYLGEVSAVDAALAPLLSDLRRDAPDSLVIVTADHGEALGDHGEKTHGLFAYESTLHVPLVLWRPRTLTSGRDGLLARHVDLLPTIFDAIGAPLLAGLPGTSLLHPPAEGAGVTSDFEALSPWLERGWAPLRGAVGGNPNRKWIDLPVPELYDLSQDPEERRNLAPGETESVRALSKAVPAELSADPRNPSAEDVARLRSLGYLSGGSGARSARHGVEDDPKNLVALDADIQRMAELWEERRVPEATSLARSVVARRPTMPAGYEFLSFLQMQSGDELAAARTLEAARKKTPLPENLLSRLGLLYSGLGRHREALAVLEALSASTNPDTWNAIGVARASSGNPAGGIEAFRHAARIDPRNAVAQQNIGLTLLREKKPAEALAAFDASAAINDRLPRAWNGRGVALQEMGRSEEAIRSWQRALELDPGQFDAMFNLGVVALEKGQVALGREALSRFVELAPPAQFREDLSRARTLLAAKAPATPGEP